MNMNENIIYGLKDPRTDEYKYVGKSIKGIERANSHLTHSHNPLVNEWINELKMDSYVPLVVILENVSDWTQLIDKEKYWVGKLTDEEHDLFNILITDSYNNTLDSYNKKLIQQIKDREKVLNEKLNKSLMQFGSESDVGDLIKRRRKTLKVTQQQLADISGVGLRTIKLIELNKSNATINTLMKIFDTLGYELFINLKTK
ncbi:MAG: helix-turn-helix domain-containing protein [Candidatus Paceibacterota bacterium]